MSRSLFGWARRNVFGKCLLPIIFYIIHDTRLLCHSIRAWFIVLKSIHKIIIISKLLLSHSRRSLCKLRLVINTGLFRFGYDICILRFWRTALFITKCVRGHIWSISTHCRLLQCPIWFLNSQVGWFLCIWLSFKHNIIKLQRCVINAFKMYWNSISFLRMWDILTLKTSLVLIPCMCVD